MSTAFNPKNLRAFLSHDLGGNLFDVSTDKDDSLVLGQIVQIAEGRYQILTAPRNEIQTINGVSIVQTRFDAKRVADNFGS